ncbi:MAG: DUF1489 domain-containing protein [Proteobacteria bacterium]|nr:DUF1489 domain-containing protein [Pseudomonadota bacterium]
MPVHLLRMAVGIESLDHLRDRQAERMAQSPGGKGKARLLTYTRNVPKRADELIADGSIYWVVKRFVRVRQKILSIEPITTEEGRRRCQIELDPTLVRTELHPHKAFQGWRYLRLEDAPPDQKEGAEAEGDEDIPAEMAAELRNLGLL